MLWQVLLIFLFGGVFLGRSGVFLRVLPFFKRFGGRSLFFWLRRGRLGSGFGLCIRLVDRLLIELHEAAIAEFVARLQYERALFFVHFDNFTDNAADRFHLAARLDRTDRVFKLLLPLFVGEKGPNQQGNDRQDNDAEDNVCQPRIPLRIGRRTFQQLFQHLHIPHKFIYLIIQAFL